MKTKLPSIIVFVIILTLSSCKKQKEFYKVAEITEAVSKKQNTINWWSWKEGKGINHFKKQ